MPVLQRAYLGGTEVQAQRVRISLLGSVACCVIFALSLLNYLRLITSFEQMLVTHFPAGHSRTGVSTSRGGTRHTPRSCVSTCREGRGCTPRSCISPCREGKGCTPRSFFSPCREGRGCTPRSRVSACRGGRGCTPRSCISPCRGGKGCTPRTGVSACRGGRGCTSRSQVSACREGRGCSPRSCLSPCREDTGCTAQLPFTLPCEHRFLSMARDRRHFFGDSAQPLTSPPVRSTRLARARIFGTGSSRRGRGMTPRARREWRRPEAKATK